MVVGTMPPSLALPNSHQLQEVKPALNQREKLTACFSLSSSSWDTLNVTNAAETKDTILIFSDCIETFERSFAGNRKGIEKDFMTEEISSPRHRSWGRYENGLLDLASLVQAP